jgi:hypothetical protein
MTSPLLVCLVTFNANKINFTTKFFIKVSPGAK